MEAILGLGSNLGDRLENLKLAIEHIGRLINTEILAVSKVYETEPFDVMDKQNCYLNCCVRIKTDFTPEILLACCLGIEAAMGRTRPYFHASRTIDIDLLMCEKIKMATCHLTLPHPEIFKRAFVMVPLLDVYTGNDVELIRDKLAKVGTAGIEIFLDNIYNAELKIPGNEGEA